MKAKTIKICFLVIFLILNKKDLREKKKLKFQIKKCFKLEVNRLDKINVIFQKYI